MTSSHHEQTPLFLTITHALRDQELSIRTQQKYLYWMRKFVYFHKQRHPKNMSEKQVQDFLSHLAVRHDVSSSTQNTALRAVSFLFQHVLDKPLCDAKLSLKQKTCATNQSAAA